MTPLRFAVAATFTAEPVRPVIEFWGRELNSEFAIEFAPYNQVHQTLLAPDSVFASNHSGVNVVLVRPSDLGGELRDLVDIVRETSSSFTVPLIFCLCPPTPKQINDYAATALQHVPGVQFLDFDSIRTEYPVDRWNDPEGDRLGKIPYTEQWFCALGTAVVRLAHTLTMPPYKAVVLDCDNTLWRGICGEDGPTGVVLDPARRAMHEFLLEQREAGMLLTMASKNNESDVLETFASNPDFPLQLRHFTSWRLNWESKADNLVALSNELGLGLDSFVFIDDNPKECAEVEDGLPDVLTLALPEPIQETPAMLRHVWAFDHPVITEEDRNRNAYYERQGQFGREARRAASLEHFLAGLNLQVRIMPLAADKVARAAQLTQRTNQFNTTSIRRTEADFLTLADHTLTVEVSDRFGDYGLTGLVISRPVAGGLEIDSLMLSCRVLGRGVEHRVLSHLGKLTDGDLFIPLGITSRNQPARQFLESVAPPVSRTEMGMLFRLPPSVRELEWKPSGTAPPATRPQPSPTAARRHFMGYARIARSLSSVDQIRAVMRAAQPRTDRQYASDTERRLAAIWSELLQKPSIAPQDNFFDLGGHSLVAVLLIMRVREVFGVELPIDDVYSGDLTIARLAARIDVHRLSRADPGDYAALVAEIESLTDEEVRELLEKEDLDACASS